MTTLAIEVRREFNPMNLPQIQNDHGWADSSVVALNLREGVGNGGERNGDTLVTASGNGATRVSPFP